jgi:hypothetical protein
MACSGGNYQRLSIVVLNIAIIDPARAPAEPSKTVRKRFPIAAGGCHGSGWDVSLEVRPATPGRHTLPVDFTSAQQLQGGNMLAVLFAT